MWNRHNKKLTIKPGDRKKKKRTTQLPSAILGVVIDREDLMPFEEIFVTVARETKCPKCQSDPPPTRVESHVPKILDGRIQCTQKLLVIWVDPGKNHYLVIPDVNGDMQAIFCQMHLTPYRFSNAIILI